MAVRLVAMSDDDDDADAADVRGLWVCVASVERSTAQWSQSTD